MGNVVTSIIVEIAITAREEEVEATAGITVVAEVMAVAMNEAMVEATAETALGVVNRCATTVAKQATFHGIALNFDAIAITERRLRACLWHARLFLAS